MVTLVHIIKCPKIFLWKLTVLESKISTHHGNTIKKMVRKWLGKKYLHTCI